MTVNELLDALQALPAQDRKLQVCGYEMSMLVELEPPRIGYRNRRNREERPASRRHQRVIVL
jgi:hypothetical protein